MNRLVPPLGPEDHTLGGSQARVSLVEFGDYECPYCGRAHQVLKRVLGALDGSVLFGFRHFPLSRMHPHASPAAQAAEAAGAQGRFWAMHNLLYENQDALEMPDLLEYASALGLDLDRFADELNSGVHLPRVRRDVRSGAHSGVNGTPSFFIDGLRYDGSWDASTLTRVLQSLRDRQQVGPAPA